MGRAWLLLSFGEDRQYAGNPGYLDEPRRVYRYDSFVPNHKQVAEGDVVLIRDHFRLQGVARIESIAESVGQKRRFRCPECGITALKERKRLRPRYRCDRSHEFDVPDEELAPCTLFAAEFGDSYVDTLGALPLQTLRSACTRYSGQMAIQEIDWESLVPGIVQKFPLLQTLLGLVSENQKTASCDFSVGQKYTRRQIYDLLQVPEDLRGGDWNTGYHMYGGDVFLFANVGSPGRGHDYENRLQGSILTWYGKSGARLDHPSIRTMLEPGRDIHVFYRTESRSAFTYAGLGQPAQVDDTVPVRIVWTLNRHGLQPPERLPQELALSQDFYEGAITRVTVNSYERNAAARKACIAYWGYNCQVCGLDLGSIYGELGQGFIHVHHLKPLSEILSSYRVDPVMDLIPVCPNCHAILHRTNPPLSVEDLRARIRRGN